MKTKREQLITWLGDAHAMEVGIISTLEKHIADAKGQPKARAALVSHLRETKQHAKEMKAALAALGGSHPVLKEGVSKLGNLVAGLLTSAAPDTIVKNAIADFATEHFEIACYTLLAATAQALGEKKIAATCQIILKQEQAMARLLGEQLPAISATYLATLAQDSEKKKSTAPKSRRAVEKTVSTRRSAPRKSAPRKAPAKRR